MFNNLWLTVWPHKDFQNQTKHYIGIDLAWTTPPRQRNGRLLFIGRLVDKKGVDILLAAMRRLHESGKVPVLILLVQGEGIVDAGG